jgi:hypothetical protein
LQIWLLHAKVLENLNQNSEVVKVCDEVGKKQLPGNFQKILDSIKALKQNFFIHLFLGKRQKQQQRAQPQKPSSKRQGRSPAKAEGTSPLILTQI